MEPLEYRCLLVQPRSGAVLAFADAGRYHLPRVHVPQATRPVQEVQRAIKARLGLSIFVLEAWVAPDGLRATTLAEVLTPGIATPLKEVSVEQLTTSELSREERDRFEALLEGRSKIPISDFGWIDEAIAWMESATGHTFCSRRDIEQWNAGGGFALMSVRSDDGQRYWLKAAGKPNAHELAITSLLSRLCRGYLPEFLGSRPEWNAWLMAGEGAGITGLPANPFELFRLLEDAVGALAELQLRTIGTDAELLDAGAFDQRLHVLADRSDALFDYIDQAMNLSAARKLPRLTKERLEEIRIALQVICERLTQLRLPETVLHGDMNPGNVVLGPEHPQFIDWSEAYVGPCLITLEHLLLFLNTVEDLEMRGCMRAFLGQKYASAWADVCEPDAMREGFRYMPLMAAVSALYGRGDWMNSPECYDIRHLERVRTLAAYMDRALHRSELQAALSVLRPRQFCMPAVACIDNAPI
jgi:hypothetical protein